MNQETVVRLRVMIEGTVQGVGFRPFASRLAQQLGVAGWITNTPRGTLLELEGSAAIVEAFLERLRREDRKSTRLNSSH